MPEITLESLAARVASLEEELADLKADENRKSKKDWRKTVGMFDDNPEFMRQVIAEGKAIRESERREAREEGPE